MNAKQLNVLWKFALGLHSVAEAGTDKFHVAVKRFEQIQKKFKIPDNNHGKTDSTGLRQKISRLLSNITETDNIRKSNEDLTPLIDEELSSLKNEFVLEVNKLVAVTILPMSFLCDKAVMRISAGVGGKEAMLFAYDLYKMYRGHAAYCGFIFEPEHVDSTETGGCRHAYVTITGPEAYKSLIFEAGVHRVQRIPETEKSGRMHTSTAAVAVYNPIDQVDIQLNPNDLKITTFRSSGPGGQHANKTETGVRILHVPTGVSVERTKHRSQIQNMDEAKKALKLLLLHRELNIHRNETHQVIKSQIGSANRNERIRTYNFPQDRITDHRINKSFGDLNKFMLGGERLSLLSDLLFEWHIDNCLK